MPHEGMPRGNSAGAEGRAAEFNFARENQEETLAKRVEEINAQISALQAQRLEGLEKSKGQTDPRLIKLGEVLDEGLDKEITRLVAEKNKLEEESGAVVQ